MAMDSVYPETQVCIDCSERKPLEAFPVHPDNRTGRRKRCRVCYGTSVTSPNNLPAPLHALLCQRLDAGLDKTGSCWLWTKARDTDGYGTITARFEGRPYLLRTHRLAYVIARGPIPEGMCILHHCDRPPCCHPDHLFLGTNAENIADRDRKGRTARGIRCGAHTHPERRVHSERVNTARLTAPQALAIRLLREQTELPYTRLGQLFGISAVGARLIVVGRNWKYLDHKTHADAAQDIVDAILQGL